MLRVAFTPQFQRDSKRLKKKHVDLGPLKSLVDLVAQDTPESLEELRRRHNMHDLRGDWAGSRECHVANAGDWLVIWREGNGLAVFQRTGSHDELFR
jgi:mRNA interferase YafQ